MRPKLLLVILALAHGLAGCELLVVGAAGTIFALAYSDGEGRKTYPNPYDQVAPLVEKAAGRLHLADMKVDRGRSKTVITGTDMGRQDVKIRAIAREGGKNTEVRVRVGIIGDYVTTSLIFDWINEDLGLPPEPPQPAPVPY